MKRAIITGITGQDGSYLTELLLEKGYEVHGIIRRASSVNTHRIDAIRASVPGARERIKLHFGDLTDMVGITKLCYDICPDEVYNLGAQSQVGLSFEIPEYTGDVAALGAMGLLEALRGSCNGKNIRVFQASTSEMYGRTDELPQRETTPFHPVSPYAVAKLYAYWSARSYREAHGMFASNGIMFAHESPRRGEMFVTRKITRAVGRIKNGFSARLGIGDLDVKRDWGFAGDYVDCMWRILQHDRPDDFIVATGELHTIREFLSEAFGYAGLDWEEYVDKDTRYNRPSDGYPLQGCYDKARNELGWEPKVKFRELVHMMVDNDIALARKELVESEVS